jgi:hypothetical protein
MKATTLIGIDNICRVLDGDSVVVNDGEIVGIVEGV